MSEQQKQLLDFHPVPTLRARAGDLGPEEGVEVATVEKRAGNETAAESSAIDVEYEVLRQASRPARDLLRRPLPRSSEKLSRVSPPVQSASAPPPKTISGSLARDIVAAAWDETNRDTPAPRHRRRLILKLLRDLSFADCLDAGCATPGLLQEIVRTRRFEGNPIAGFSCDSSGNAVRQMARESSGGVALKLDLSREAWPGGRQFDLVLCSEVLESIPQWRSALANLVRMTRRYLLITVPGGPVRMSDRIAGHYQHFDGLELAGAIVGHGLTLLKQRRWGFPAHSLYRSALDSLAAHKLDGAHSSEASPSLPMRLVSQGLYLAFFSNDLFHAGSQQILLAERRA